MQSIGKLKKLLITILLSLSFMFGTLELANSADLLYKQVAERVYEKLENRYKDKSEVEKMIIYSVLSRKLDDLVLKVKDDDTREVVKILKDMLDGKTGITTTNRISSRPIVKPRNQEEISRSYPETDDPSGISLEELKDIGEKWTNDLENRIYYLPCKSGETRTIYIDDVVYKEDGNIHEIELKCDKRVGRFYVPLSSGFAETTLPRYIGNTKKEAEKILLKKQGKSLRNPVVCKMFPYMLKNGKRVCSMGNSVIPVGRFLRDFGNLGSSIRINSGAIRYFGTCDKKSQIFPYRSNGLSHLNISYFADGGTNVNFVCDKKLKKYMSFGSPYLASYVMDKETANNLHKEFFSIYSLKNRKRYTENKLVTKKFPKTKKTITATSTIISKKNINSAFISKSDNLNDLYVCHSIIEHPVKGWITGDRCKNGEGFYKVKSERLLAPYVGDLYNKGYKYYHYKLQYLFSIGEKVNSLFGFNSKNPIVGPKYIPGTRVIVYFRDGNNNKNIVKFPITVIDDEFTSPKPSKNNKYYIELLEEMNDWVGYIFNRDSVYPTSRRVSYSIDEQGSTNSNGSPSSLQSISNIVRYFGSCSGGDRNMYYKTGDYCEHANFNCKNGRLVFNGALQFSPGPVPPSSSAKLYTTEAECKKANNICGETLTGGMNGDIISLKSSTGKLYWCAGPSNKVCNKFFKVGHINDICMKNEVSNGKFTLTILRNSCPYKGNFNIYYKTSLGNCAQVKKFNVTLK